MKIPALTEIIEQAFGDDLKAQALKIVRKRLDGQIGRSAGKALGTAAHKAIAAVMGPGMPGTLEQRIDAGLLFAEGIAVQCEQLAASLRAFAQAQARRERTRGTAEAGDALEIREAVEAEVMADAIDIGRVINGDDPSERG